MSRSDKNVQELFAAICDLTNPQRREINRGGSISVVNVASLWDTLLRAIGSPGGGSGGGGSHAPGSKLPLMVEGVDLATAIQRSVARDLRAANRREFHRRRSLVRSIKVQVFAVDQLGEIVVVDLVVPDSCAARPPDVTGVVPKDLRSLYRRYRQDPIRAAELAARIRKWITDIGNVAGLNVDLPTGLRVPCMQCGASGTTAPKVQDGKVIRVWVPALQLIWTEYGSSDKREPKIRAAHCRVCETTFWPGQFEAIAASAGIRNLMTREATA